MHNLDSFGNRINLNLNSEEKIYTKIGGYLSVLTFLLVLFFCWLIGEDLIFKQKPFTNQFKETMNYTSNISFKNNSQLFFGFGLQDFYGKNMNLTNYFELEVFKTSIIFNQSNMNSSIINNTKINISFCEPQKLKLQNLNIKQETVDYLSNLYCMDFNDLNIYGSWSESSLSYFTINLKKCINPEEAIYTDKSFYDNNDNQLCKSDSEIQDFLNSNQISFNLFYFTNSIKLEDYQNPIKYYLNNIYYYIQLGSMKNVYLSAYNNTLITNDAFIFNNAENDYFYTIDEDRIDNFSSNSTLFTLEFYSSNISYTYHRRYIKVTEILASLGGFLKVFTLLFRKINRTFAFFKKNELIIERTFSLFREGEYNVGKLNSLIEKTPQKKLTNFSSKLKTISLIETRKKQIETLTKKTNEKYVVSCSKENQIENNQNIELIAIQNNRNNMNDNINNRDFDEKEELEENVLEYLKDNFEDSNILKFNNKTNLYSKICEIENNEFNLENECITSDKKIQFKSLGTKERKSNSKINNFLDIKHNVNFRNIKHFNDDKIENNQKENKLSALKHERLVELNGDIERNDKNFTNIIKSEELCSKEGFNVNLESDRDGKLIESEYLPEKKEISSILGRFQNKQNFAKILNETKKPQISDVINNLNSLELDKKYNHSEDLLNKQKLGVIYKNNLNDEKEEEEKNKRLNKSLDFLLLNNNRDENIRIIKESQKSFKNLSKKKIDENKSNRINSDCDDKLHIIQISENQQITPNKNIKSELDDNENTLNKNGNIPSTPRYLNDYENFVYEKNITNPLYSSNKYYSTLFQENYSNYENIKLLKKKILLRTKDLKIKMEFSDVLNYFYINLNCKKCCKKKSHKEIEIKYKLFNLANHRIVEYCDIAKIIKFQNYFNNFERVILNEHQLNAIKLMEKPILTSDSNYKRSQSHIESKFIDEIIDYLEDCSKRKKSEPIDFDEKIIKLICY